MLNEDAGYPGELNTAVGEGEEDEELDKNEACKSPHGTSLRLLLTKYNT